MSNKKIRERMLAQKNRCTKCRRYCTPEKCDCNSDCHAKPELLRCINCDPNKCRKCEHAICHEKTDHCEQAGCRDCQPIDPTPVDKMRDAVTLGRGTFKPTPEAIKDYTKVPEENLKAAEKWWDSMTPYGKVQVWKYWEEKE
jgi:hypothetical protein